MPNLPPDASLFFGMWYEDTFKIVFGNPFPRLQLLSVHRFVTGLGLRDSQIMVIAPVLLVGVQVMVRVTLFETADVTAILTWRRPTKFYWRSSDQRCHQGLMWKSVLWGYLIAQRMLTWMSWKSDYANLELAWPTPWRLCQSNFRNDSVPYWATHGENGMVTPNTPYLQVVDHKVYIRYANQTVKCRECNLLVHMALECPTRKTHDLPAPP